MKGFEQHLTQSKHSGSLGSYLGENGSQAESVCGKFLWPVVVKVAGGIEVDHFL